MIEFVDSALGLIGGIAFLAYFIGASLLSIGAVLIVICLLQLVGIASE